MGWNHDIDETTRETDEFLELLVNLGRLEGPALGIAKKVLAEGEGGLSGRQRHVYETEVLGDYADMECKRCMNPIPLNEAICAREDNGGYCAYCANAMSKDD